MIKPTHRLCEPLPMPMEILVAQSNVLAKIGKLFPTKAAVLAGTEHQ